ncbi:MAG TPA: glycosyltransferase [Polyangiaceae bacterium]|nr:glycosyltransferase [Polyangiaceae bacterium]
MKVLLAPVGSRGDVQPQLLLGDELKKRGHTVTLAAAPNFRSWAEPRGFKFIPVGEDINTFMRRNAYMTEQHPVAALPGQIQLLREHIEWQIGDLFAADHDADIVVGAGLCYGGKMVAEKRGVPHVFCCYSLSAMHSAAHPPAVIPLYGMPRLANRALWSFITSTFQVTLGTKLNELRRRLGLKPDYDAWKSIHGSETILAQDAIMGELPSDAPGRNLHVPALVPHPDSARPLSDLLERFLRGGSFGSADSSPVVYLGFGSMPSVDRPRIVQIATDLFERHGARVILQSSHAEEQGIDLPPGVFPLDDADHASLFPRVDLIVHHGGAGTTAAALRSGVPQLIVPHIVDQFFHGRRIAELGVGPAPIPKSKLTADSIAAPLTDRFKYWSKAQTTRSQLKPAGGAPQAADHLEHLAGKS